MASGLESGAAIAGLISLAFNAFEGCLEAYKFVYTAQHIGTEGDAVQSKLVWERHRLWEWGERTGIQTSAAQEKLNWSLATIFLQEQKDLMTSATELEAKYKLRVPVDVVGAKDAESRTPNDTTLGKLLQRLKPDTPQPTGESIQANNGTLKRLRWAAIGKSQALRIVKDIEELNNRLYNLLDSADQKRMQATTNALLRDLIDRSKSSKELETIRDLLYPKQSFDDQQLAAAAELKQIMSIVGRNQQTPGLDLSKLVEMGLKLKLLSAKKLKPSPPVTSLRFTGVELGQYKGTNVLIEWRFTDEETWELMEPHMRALTVLLGKMDRRVFPVLPCLGLISSKELDSFALVYDLSSISEKGTRLELKPLYEIISEQPEASLSRRFGIALGLAEALLHFHTAGWLHKGIRSENILFLTSAEASLEQCLGTQAYLVGFEHARPDSDDGQALTQLPQTDLRADLYRHPMARGSDRQPFRKSFDLYALGCVLLELGSWRRLVDLHADENLENSIEHADKNQKMMALPSLVDFGCHSEDLAMLTHAAGQKFADVVTRCLTSSGKNGEKTDDFLDTQKWMVDVLRRCSC